jgi:hypothetical protein
MKCKILVRPSGSYNGEEWPEVGETIDLPTSVAEGMAVTGIVEIVSSAAQKAAEKKAADADPDHAPPVDAPLLDEPEKRPASTKAVETRPGATHAKPTAKTAAKPAKG